MALLNAAEPALFAEFEFHYAQMGEKSFDHTKKYLFNPLRRKYHAPEDPKVEKIIIENPLAEQTITEAISEQTEFAASPKVGFKPRFKAPGTIPVTTESTPVPSEEKIEPMAVAPAPKVGFKPRFNAAAMLKPAEEKPIVPEEKVEPTAIQAPVPKVGFKPRFKVATTPKQDIQTDADEKPEE